MKKMNNLWTLVAAMTCGILALGSLNSCVFIEDDDPDVNTSYYLSGDWQGDFGMYYDYYDRYGRFVDSFDSYDTDISFYPDHDYATHGYGYQVDFYRYGPYEKIYHSFEWEVRKETLYLYYMGERDLDTIIYDYRLTSTYFSGYFKSSDSRFSLKKYRGYYNWDSYWHDYGSDSYGYYDRYGWYDDYYNARTRSAAPAVDAEELKADGKNFTIHFGNRFNK